MQVHYYEATALCHPGHAPDQTVTLENYHRTAWQLFSGGAHTPARQRPFIFRFDWLTQERHLFSVRSAHEFPHATKRGLALCQGDTLRLEWCWVPTIATRLSPSGEKLSRSQHIPAPRERWENVVTQRMLHQGFNIKADTLSFSPLGSWQHKPHHPSHQSVVLVNAEVTVIDEAHAANAWLQGVSRLRAYGMGMLCQR
ncbi:type I-E CRISPR-associated protein Cas6/Cse3/CasE [Vreelandella andesensis]|uniref:Type I-E CRISPR-associated protein Cas6/Cse3/CasE n=1 Tax=Vreelandella andesensis TaxID=447567 RepID=A0A433KJ47_9GAMM|nr:type I-E CRISPR-associated protein Cas6/Cse3/CasE [Halomonas andesensis]RUR29716.1 type I-E CRISPR-associated protein Cas6/Cse3/CasE [Halomonas andesensis]